MEALAEWGTFPVGLWIVTALVFIGLLWRCKDKKWTIMPWPKKRDNEE